MQPSPITDFLFCKPSPGTLDLVLYDAYDTLLDNMVRFRSLNLKADIHFLYDWVNRPYSRRFWQLNGTKTLLHDTYQSVLNNPNAHSFIGLLNDQPVCQVDLYNIAADELVSHINYEPGDCGLHLLMIPPQQMSRGLSVSMLRHFIRFYFSHAHANRLFAEPDRENALANKLAKETGFAFLKTIQLSYKTANLYSITKQQFNATNTVL